MRLSDNPALSEAVNSGAYVIPVFIYDDWFAARCSPKISFGKKFSLLQKQYERLGSYLTIEKGHQELYCES